MFVFNKKNIAIIILIAMGLFGSGIWAGSTTLDPRVIDQIKTKKTASMEELAGFKISNENAGLFLYQRTAAITVAQQPPNIQYGPHHLTNLGGGNNKGFGLATAISNDGYFLTAAHCLTHEYPAPNKPVWLISLATKDRYLTTAEVVWLSEEIDLALLKADLEPSHWFTVEEGPVTLDSKVIAGGLTSGHGIGQLISRTKLSQSPETYIRLEHDAPTIYGDSGGPLITERGNLIGINYQFNPRHQRGLADFFSSESLSYATLITQDWLQPLLAKDRELKAEVKSKWEF